MFFLIEQEKFEFEFEICVFIKMQIQWNEAYS